METTVSQKLEALLKLQSIDSQVDEIKKIRGDLPEEVQDLEDEIAGYDTRLNKFNAELKGFEDNIKGFKDSIKDSEKLIKKYEEQQMNVRNNREYDAITKEMELQQLEIQISEKKIKECYASIEFKKKDVEKTQGILDERKKDLESKKEELTVIISESEDDESKLSLDRDKAAKKVDERLFTAYERIRTNVRNGLAVVSVKRDACGGCFNTVPLQRQAEIRERKKVIVCEHCGRILAEVETVIEEEKPKKRKKAASA